MMFYDEILQTVIETIGAANLTDFSFALAGNGMASLIDAFGKPADDGTPLIATDDATGSLLMTMPRYDATPAYPTVSDPNEPAGERSGVRRGAHGRRGRVPVHVLRAGLHRPERD